MGAGPRSRNVVANAALSATLGVGAALGAVAAAQAFRPAERGMVAVLATTSVLCYAAVSAGPSSATAFMLRREGVLDRQLVHIVIKCTVVLALLSAAVTAALGHLLADGADGPALLAFAAFSASATVTTNVLGLALGLGRGTAFNVYRTILNLSLPAAFALALVTDIGVAGVGLVATVVNVVVLGVSAGTLVPAIATRAGDGIERISDQWASFALRASGGTVASALNARVDLLVAGALLEPEQTGVYAVASSYTTVVRLLPESLNFVFFSQHAGGRLSPAMLRAALRWTMPVTGGVAVVAYGAAATIVREWFGQAYVSATSLARILVVGAAASAISSTLGTVLRGVDRPGSQAIADLAGSVVTVACALGIGALVTPTGTSIAVASSLGFAASLALMLGFTLSEMRRIRESAAPNAAMVPSQDE